MADNITIIKDTVDARYAHLQKNRYNRTENGVDIKLDVEQIEAAIYGQTLAIDIEGSFTVFLTVEQFEEEK